MQSRWPTPPRRNLPRFVVLALLVLVICRAPLAAQQQFATLNGVVADAAGEALEGIVVRLRDRTGSTLAVTRSGAGGRFTFEQVGPGAYTVTADAGPRGRSDPRMVVLSGPLPVSVELRLVPRAAEHVVVTGMAGPPSVTTRQTIGGSSLRETPARMRGRALPQLLATLPGWATEDNGLLHVRGVDDGVLYVQDGVPVYDRLDMLSGFLPDPSTLEMVNVLTGYIPPEFGLKSGAVVELQSAAAGRNDWTGSLETTLGDDAARSLRLAADGPVRRGWSAGGGVTAERSDRFLDPVHPRNFHNAGGVLLADGRLNVASQQHVLRVHVTAGRARHQVPHGEAQESARQDQRQRLQQNSQSASWQRMSRDTTAWQTAIYRRDISAELRGDHHDTPLEARSQRQQHRVGLLASVTHQRGRHTIKGGFEAARLLLQEDFRFAITDRAAAIEAGISPPAAAFGMDDPFIFTDSISRWQGSGYVQDTVRLADRLTADFGVRFDRTRLLVPASGWSPRLGVAYTWPQTATTARASLNRFFQPPQAEHLLLSSSPAARALSPFAGGAAPDGSNDGLAAGGAELQPERQTAWNLGMEQWVAGLVRLDVGYWRRHVRNYSDPNVFFGTTIVFPNSVAEGTARGVDLQAELPRYGSWAASVTYTHSKVEQMGPINGGLFLEEDILEIGAGTRFIPDHDQRHVAAGGVTYHHAASGFAASLSARYASGTPLEVEDDELDDLVERPGGELVDIARGRVRARTVVDLGVSYQMRPERPVRATLRLSVLNVTNRAYALNFGNPFSGTHFGAPRALRAELSVIFG